MSNVNIGIVPNSSTNNTTVSCVSCKVDARFVRSVKATKPINTKPVKILPNGILGIPHQELRNNDACYDAGVVIHYFKDNSPKALNYLYKLSKVRNG